MKNPFKSKYYFRIIDRIAELENRKADIETAKMKLKETLQPKEYCSFVIRISGLQKEIDLLRNLL